MNEGGVCRKRNKYRECACEKEWRKVMKEDGGWVVGVKFGLPLRQVLRIEAGKESKWKWEGRKD